jgi:hypothetical protein
MVKIFLKQNKNRLIELASSIEMEAKCFVQQNNTHKDLNVSSTRLNASSSELVRKELKNLFL